EQALSRSPSRSPPLTRDSWCLSKQGLRAHDHAVLVGVDVVAGLEGDAAEAYRYVDLADVALDRLPGMGAQREHAEVHLADRLRVTDAAIDDDAGPAVLDRQLGELVADQGAAHRGAAVDHQHATVAGALHRLADEGVVLEDLQRGDRPAEGRAAA